MKLMTAECTDLLHSLALLPEPPPATAVRWGCFCRGRAIGAAKTASRPVDITPGKGARRVLEDRHGGCHAPKAKRLVKSLLSGHRIQDDFPVRAREPNK